MKKLLIGAGLVLSALSSNAFARGAAEKPMDFVPQACVDVETKTLAMANSVRRICLGSFKGGSKDAITLTTDNGDMLIYKIKMDGKLLKKKKIFKGEFRGRMISPNVRGQRIRGTYVANRAGGSISFKTTSNVRYSGPLYFAK